MAGVPRDDWILKVGVGVGRVLSRKSRLGGSNCFGRDSKERRSEVYHLYAARAVDVKSEEGIAARLHRPVRERPHRPTTLHTHD